MKAKIASNTVILDVRAPFEFNVSHIPGSINVAWEDFSRRSPDHRGQNHESQGQRPCQHTLGIRHLDRVDEEVLEVTVLQQLQIVLHRG